MILEIGYDIFSGEGARKKDIFTARLTIPSKAPQLAGIFMDTIFTNLLPLMTF